jgi:hypothetical protein
MIEAMKIAAKSMDRAAIEHGGIAPKSARKG